MKKQIAITSVLTLSALISGCTPSSPKEHLEKSFAKTMEANSYDFTVVAKVDLDLNDTNRGEDLSMAESMLKNAELKIEGTYQKDPAQIEMDTHIFLKGDVSIDASVPIILTEEKAWIKIPNIPIYQIPEEYTQKYIEFDLEEMKEDLDLADESAFKPEEVQELVTKVLGIAIDALDSEGFIDNVKKPKNGIQIKVNDGNIEKFMTTLNDDAMPKIVDVIAEPKWSKLLNIDPEDIEMTRDDLKDGREDLLADIAEMKETIRLNDVSLTIATDKKNFFSSIEFNVDVDLNSEEVDEINSAKVNAKVNFTNINKKPKFDLEIPTGDNVIPFEELMGSL